MSVVRNLGPGFGAEVDGIDLDAPWTAEATGLFRQLLHEHALILVRSSGHSPAALARLATALGEPRDETRKQFAIAGLPMICRLGNTVDADGQPTAFFNRQGEEWHSDGVGSGAVNGITLLAAVDVPRRGGETMFASLHTAWDTLDPAMRADISGLRVLHSFNWHNDKVLALSQGAAKPLTAAERAAIPDRWYDLVQKHPVTGRALYYLSPNLVREISGLDDRQRDELVTRLVDHATAPQRVYCHQWIPGDLLVWDNNALMHSATNVEHYEQDRRLMHRCFTVPRSTTD
jgi:taurine dioxygenase